MNSATLVCADIACCRWRSLSTAAGAAAALFVATTLASLADAWQTAAGLNAAGAAGPWSLLRLGAFAAVGALIALSVLAVASALRARVETVALLERLGTGEQTLVLLTALGSAVLFGVGGLLGAVAAKIVCEDKGLLRGLVAVPVVVGWPRLLFAAAMATVSGMGASLVAVKALRPHLARAHERLYPTTPPSVRPGAAPPRQMDRLEL